MGLGLGSGLGLPIPARALEEEALDVRAVLGRRGHVLLLHRDDGELPAQGVHAHLVGVRVRVGVRGRVRVRVRVRAGVRGRVRVRVRRTLFARAAVCMRAVRKPVG